MAASKGFAEDQEPFVRGTDEARSVPHARLKVDKAGRIVIPAENACREWAYRSGIGLLPRLVDGELRLLSREAGLRRAQQLVRQYVPEGTCLVDELLAERRAEAGKRGCSVKTVLDTFGGARISQPRNGRRHRRRAALRRRHQRRQRHRDRQQADRWRDDTRSSVGSDRTARCGRWSRSIWTLPVWPPRLNARTPRHKGLSLADRLCLATRHPQRRHRRDPPTGAWASLDLPCPIEVIR